MNTTPVQFVASSCETITWTSKTDPSKGEQSVRKHVLSVLLDGKVETVEFVEGRKFDEGLRDALKRLQSGSVAPMTPISFVITLTRPFGKDGLRGAVPTIVGIKLDGVRDRRETILPSPSECPRVVAK